jgi:competence protein ComEC
MDNNRSLVLELRYGAVSVLLTGDIEAEAERALVATGQVGPVTVLKVPHHGARGSLDPDFLLRVRPQIAVISAGPANPYGHPADETLEAYRLLESRLLRTDRDGAVLLRTDGRRVELETARALRAQSVVGRPEPLRTEWRNLVTLSRDLLGLPAGW